MDILTLARELREAADLVVADKDGRSLLLVEIYPSLEFELEYLARLRDDHQKFGFPFAMFANPNQIWLFGPGQSDKPVARFSTDETLKIYRSPYFNPLQPSSDDLSYPIKRWLDDFTTNRDFDRPPHRRRLEEVGLVDRLLGGSLLFQGMLFQAEYESERFL